MQEKEPILSHTERLDANNNRSPDSGIEDRIFNIRGVQVIIDRDLAELYSVPTSRLNEQVRRNIRRFPASFRFQLTKEEVTELIANCDRLSRLKHSTSPPYVFTEQGVAMLSAVLHNATAIDVSINVIEAFVAMRRFLASNATIFQRLETIEYKLLESDRKFEDMYSKLEEKTITPRQGIFFDGQIYDAYEFISNLVKGAKARIILIDNYVDDTVLSMMDKRDSDVEASIYTLKISNQFSLDIAKHNDQYPTISVNIFTKSHDRFLIVDEKVYHIGASLKDLGKKWFAFSLMEELSPDELLSRL